MPTFDAGEVVESLDWDFTSPKIGVAALRKAKGTIPEPTDAAIGRFLDGLKKLYTESQKELTAELPEDATPDQMLDALSQLTGESFVKFMADTAELFAELCSNKPDKEQLLLLPLRVRVKFFAWVQQEVVNPEAGTGGGTAAVVKLSSAAAG
jgi:hypothetical protein